MSQRAACGQQHNRWPGLHRQSFGAHALQLMMLMHFLFPFPLLALLLYNLFSYSWPAHWPAHHWHQWHRPYSWRHRW
ncbi:hypothetical protein COO60DRAFT_1500661 [Scenedesmus sp. NREL 46B-D3]|nr:hypothetical protein COO60DRAFT_1500661 [Scenedesmus sp. NREL 46B-D3]